MTLSLATRLRRLLKRYTPLQILDAWASIQQAEADECGKAGKDSRCHGGIQEQAYCCSTRLHHEARELRKCAAAIRCRDLERPAARSPGR